MEHQSTPNTTAERIKQWLLSRRHIFYRKEEQASDLAWLRLSTSALIGWALTRAPLLFSVNPLPISAVIASSHSTLSLLFGVLLGLWQGAPHPSVTLLSIGAGLLIRLCFRLFCYPAGDANAEARKQYRHDLFRRLLATLQQLWHNSSTTDPVSVQAFPPLPVSLRTLSAAVGGISGALLHCVIGNFSFYDLWGAVLLLLLTPVACALYCFSFDHRIRHISSVRAYLGHGAMVWSICFCLRSVFFLLISPAITLLLAFSLFFVRKQGMLPATGCLLLGGLAIDLAVLPPLLVALLPYTIFYRAMGRIALILAAALSLATTLAGGEGLFLRLAPSICAGFLLMSVFLSLEKHRAHIHHTAQNDYRHDTLKAALIAEKQRCDRLTSRLCAMAGAFDGLSEIMVHMQSIAEKKAVDTPPYTSRDFAYYAPAYGPFAQHCTVAASVLRDASNENALTLTPDDETSLRLGQALKEHGAQFHHACVLSSETGRCRVQLHGCSSTHLGMDEKKLHHIAQSITGASLRLPEFDDTGEDGDILTLRPRPPITVQYSAHSLSAGESLCDPSRSRDTKKPLCGDSMRFFTDGQERFFALLCDGMGTGEDAAVTSQTGVLLLERMLRAGVGNDTALSLLNLCLRSRAGQAAEISSTVDLMTLDPFNGRARFIKSGAADTLIWRDGQIYNISSRTFPLGILASVDMQIIPFTLRAGDCVLMMSDGVADVLLSPASVAVTVGSVHNGDPTATTDAAASISDERLSALLRDFPPTDDSATATLPQRILRLAREQGSVDDMTVALLRVVKN